MELSTGHYLCRTSCFPVISHPFDLTGQPMFFPSLFDRQTLETKSLSSTFTWLFYVLFFSAFLNVHIHGLKRCTLVGDQNIAGTVTGAGVNPNQILGQIWEEKCKEQLLQTRLCLLCGVSKSVGLNMEFAHKDLVTTTKHLMNKWRRGNYTMSFITLYS